MDIETIVRICKENGIEAVHPGYGFLSENLHFAQSLKDAGITFVGPTPQNLATFGDKTAAREAAIRMNVPVVPGTEDALSTPDEARKFIEDPKNKCGYPAIVKAAMGGGGRGIRVVESADKLDEMFQTASNEALTAFGDGRCFVEKLVETPRHIEVQCLGDGTGNVVHLYDRDCSVQRRHQKVVECAPSLFLKPETREAMLNDAVRLLSSENYLNAGTVEFLVDKHGNHFFMEVNPRVQVEHTVSEEITGIDIVQSQIKIAGGAKLEDLGLIQDSIKEHGYAMQVRVTTEDPSQDFRPDTGTIDVFRMPAGMGIRLDDGPGFPGAKITPHYDSLLVKITAKARTRHDATIKLIRALHEFRVRGVQTNKSFLLNVLKNDDFKNGAVDTGFISQNPSLLAPLESRDRAQKLLHYIGCLVVNGAPKNLGITENSAPPSDIIPIVPELVMPETKERSLKQIYDQDGPAAFAEAVRSNKGLLITDTTWRDAHQSLLATKMRTYDMLKVAEPTCVALRNAYSLECWGGATFDVAMRFLKECPWDRLGQVSFQLLSSIFLQPFFLNYDLTFLYV